MAGHRNGSKLAYVTFMPGAREIPDPQAEIERLAAMRSGVPVTETPGEAAEITVEPVAVAKLAADAAHYSTAGYVLLKMDTGNRNRAEAALTFEVHDDGTVIPPDDWEAVIEDGMITGARRTGQPAPNAHLRRWRRR